MIMKGERYLDERSLTRAETAHAIGSIFKSSSYAERMARKICLDTLPIEPNHLEDRKPTYRKLALELDADGESACQELGPSERCVDLFERMVLCLECEMGIVSAEMKAQLNFKAITKILDPNENLLPEEDAFKLSALWSSVVYQHDLRRSVSDKQVISMLNNFDRCRVSSKPAKLNATKLSNNQFVHRSAHAAKKDAATSKKVQFKQKCGLCDNDHETKSCKLFLEGPCTICIEKGRPKGSIYHTTKEHIFPREQKGTYSKSSGTRSDTGFTQAPAHLQKIAKENTRGGGAIETLIEETNNALDRQEVVLSKHLDPKAEANYACIRLELRDMLITTKLDSGCSVSGVIDESFAKELGIFGEAVENEKTLTCADGSKVSCDRKITMPARFRQVSTMLEFIIMPKLPSKILLGLPGMRKLKLMNIFNHEKEYAAYDFICTNF